MQRTITSPAANPELQFSHLPPEMQLHIFSHLDLPDLQHARNVSPAWHSIYHAINNRSLADKALAFLKRPDSHLLLTNALLQNISHIVQSYPAQREKFYFILRDIRRRLLDIYQSGQDAEKRKLKVAPADVQQCLISTFGLAAYFEDSLLMLFLQPRFEPKLLASYFAPFVVLRNMLQNGGGKFELKLCNKIYTKNILEKLVFTDNELYFVLRHQPEQRFTLSQFIDRLFDQIVNDNQLSQLKTNINHFAAGIMRANNKYSCAEQPAKKARK